MADFSQHSSGFPLDISSPTFFRVFLPPLSFDSTWIILYRKANLNLFLLIKRSNLVPVVEIRLCFLTIQHPHIFFSPQRQISDYRCQELVKTSLALVSGDKLLSQDIPWCFVLTHVDNYIYEYAYVYDSSSGYDQMSSATYKIKCCR